MRVATKQFCKQCTLSALHGGVKLLDPTSVKAIVHFQADHPEFFCGKYVFASWVCENL